MTRKSRLPQSPRHVMIYDEDWDFLSTYYARRGADGSPGTKPLGPSTAVRELVHKWVTRLKAAAEAKIDSGPGEAGI